MSDSDSWFQQIPLWVWLACIPIFGGGAIVYAGIRIDNKSWVAIGAGFVIVVFLPIDPALITISLIAQIVTAFAIKRKYLIKTYPNDFSLPEDPKLFKAIAANRPKVDINSCSKNDLVNVLGLPIVYANDIDSLRAEGHIFTSLEELHDVLEIPNATLNKIESLVVFSYDYRQEAGYSWKRINSMTADDLVGLGLEPNVAKAIAAERQSRGEFKSIMDIKKRTGIPFSAYKHLT
jgi:DNA uptake protein ComE-like DNA-binding protein